MTSPTKTEKKPSRKARVKACYLANGPETAWTLGQKLKRSQRLERGYRDGEEKLN
jgi:hypothetical protein